MATRRIGAQITFRQSSDGKRWRGSLLSLEARDRQDGGRLARFGFTCEIVETTTPAQTIGSYELPAVTSYQLVTQGSEPGGRRYRGFKTLDEAQDAAINWARRRFYVEIYVPDKAQKR